MVQRARKRIVYIRKTRRTHEKRRCKHYPDGDKIGVRWAVLYQEDGTSCFRCQQCLYEQLGFMPSTIRLMRKNRRCHQCKITQSVIGFRSEIPAPQGQKAFLCKNCFIRMGEFEND